MQSDLLNLEQRRKIYNHIKKNPGLHFREISRELKKPKTTIEYHLYFLEKKGFITKQKEKGYLRYYIKKTIGEKDKEIINMLRKDVPRNIILFLLMNPCPTMKDIKFFAKKWKGHPSKIGFHLYKHQTTLSFHIKKLIKSDIIGSYQDKKTKKYFVKNPENIYNIIITYEKSILDEANNRYLKYIDKTFNIVIRRVEKKAYEIFPPPYTL